MQFNWSWNKGSSQTQAVTESDEAREIQRERHELEISMAVNKERIKNERAKIRGDAVVREQLRALAWAKSGHPVFTRDSEHGEELDVSRFPAGWPTGVNGDSFLNEQFAARGWADE